MKITAWLIKKSGWHRGEALLKFSLSGGGEATMRYNCSLREYESRQLGEEITLDIPGVIPAAKRLN